MVNPTVLTLLRPGQLARSRTTPPDLFRRDEAKGGILRLIADSDWGRIGDHLSGWVDCGEKHPARGLAKYLPLKGEVFLLRSRYSKAGRCFQSVLRTLEHPFEGVLILVIPDETFRVLAGRAISVEADSMCPVSIRKGRGMMATGEAARLLLRQLGPVPADHPSRRRFVGRSVSSELVRVLIDRAGRCSAPVLILGESGTGKEVVARLLHDCSSRLREPFLAVNCAAIPRELLESELFGTCKGAFSSAVEKIGLWERAGEGTLFLDEVGDLSPEHQAKILRVLEEKRIRPVGGLEDRPVCARIVAATQRSLLDKVERQQFRADLYFRLGGFRITLESLDENRGDIPVLARYFWRQITGDPEASIHAEFLEALEQRRWPGNGRQLKAFLQEIYHLFETNHPNRLHFDLLQAHRTGQGEANPPKGSVAIDPTASILDQCGRAARALRAIDLALRELLMPGVGSESDGGGSISCRAVLTSAVSELERLAGDPLGFGSERAYRSIEGILDLADQTDGIVHLEDRERSSIRERELGTLVASGLSVLFEEMEGFRRSLGAA